MAKTKSKVDFKQLLLTKGEYIALGVAGFFLVILLFSGIGKWMSAKNPAEIANNLKSSAKSVHSKIDGTQISPDDEKATILPPWVTKENKYPPVYVQDFQVTNPQFDPIAKPDTKKENPNVLDLQGANYQVDLARCSYQAFDITLDRDRNAQIAVITDKTVSSKMDEAARRAVVRNTKHVTDKLLELEKRQNSNLPPGGPVGPGGMGPGMGPGGMGPGRPGGMGSGSGTGSGSGMGSGGMRPGGLGGQGFEANNQRTEKTIKYIPIEDLDKAMAEGQIPATTVIPFEAVILHAEIPYKKQIEEIKRALRLSSDNEAKMWGPIYDGFEVQRRVSRVINGQEEEVSGWSKYQFEDTYQEKVYSKKLADTVEGGFLSYFLRYEMALALPLPQLVSELGEYPKIRLENINNTIKKLELAGTKTVQPSDTLERLSTRRPRNEMYKLQSASDTGAQSFSGMLGGPMVAPKKQMSGNTNTTPPALMSYRPGMMDSSNTNAATPVDIEQLLLRFVDAEITPGLTYQYKIRLRMLNPNFDRPSEVANPVYAKADVLYSGWVEFPDRITIPPKHFLYAADVAAYRKTIEETYANTKDPKETELRNRLQVKENQAVVEICEWKEQVRTDSGKREPVGAWVVADIPVARGEYIGRKQFVKLPLWSSERKSYVLREMTTSAAKGGHKEVQPKGWMVDFSASSPDILVDFEGGRVPTRKDNKTIMEDVDSELLIVSPNGKLTVRKSVVDEADPKRRQITGLWNKWISEVEKRGTAGTPAEDNFAPKPGMSP